MRDREKLRDALAALALADARAKLLASGMDWTLRAAWTGHFIPPERTRKTWEMRWVHAVCEHGHAVDAAAHLMRMHCVSARFAKLAPTSPSRDHHLHRHRAIRTGIAVARDARN